MPVKLILASGTTVTRKIAPQQSALDFPHRRGSENPRVEHQIKPTSPEE